MKILMVDFTVKDALSKVILMHVGFGTPSVSLLSLYIHVLISFHICNHEYSRIFQFVDVLQPLHQWGCGGV